MTEHDDANVPPEMRSDSHAELDTDPRVAERFARLARVDAPDTWERATRVAAAAPASTDRRWWAAAAAAVLLVVAVVGVAVTRGSDDRPAADDETAVSSEATEAPASSTSGPPTATTVPAPLPMDDLPALRAVVEPPSASPGGQVTITPAAQIQPTCTDIGSLFDLRADPPVRLGLLGVDGRWFPEAPSITLPACLPPMSDLPATYTVPADVPGGQLAVCRNIEFSLDGCGLVDIVQPNETQDPPPDGTEDPSSATPDRADGDAIAAEIGLSELDEPAWFSARTDAPTCGLVAGEASAPEPWSDDLSIDCFATAVENNERAELVTVHTGDDRRVARWMVSLGPGPSGIERFEVASVVVDEGAVTTRWFETRCVEGEFVGGRLVGDFIVDRDLVDELDPSGTVITDNGEVLELPDPDERSQLQPCNGPAIVDRPVVTPFEATGLRVGDEPAPATRPAGFNEIGEYDLTVAPSWVPVGASDAASVIGFVRADTLEFPPSPDDIDFDDQFNVIYDDDGITRLGEFGPDGFPTLDG